MRLLWHLVGRSSTGWFSLAADLSSILTWIRSGQKVLQSSIGWFNPAAVIQVESMKPTRFILPAIRKFLFLWHALSLWGLLFQWYMSNLQSTMNRYRYQHSCTRTGHTAWIQQRPHFYARFLLQSQKSGWVSQRTVTETIQKAFNIILLATYSPSLFAGPCEVPSMNLAITSNNGPRQSDLPTSTFFLCHCWSRTPLGRGGCTNTTNTMYKTHKAIQLLEEWRGGWYNQSIPMVTAGGIISPYLWLPLVG